MQLPQEDIREELNDLCVSYVEEAKMAPRDRRSVVSLLSITPAETDYAVNLENAPDFEEQMLEASLITDGNWYKVGMVEINQWADQFDQGRTIACFYGNADDATPPRLKLNLAPEQVALRNFRLTYRLPMTTILQYGSKPPLPAAHIPMLKREAAILLAPQVINETDWWKNWMKETIPVYVAKLADLKLKWKAYLDSGDDSEMQPIRPFNSFRQRGSRGPLPFVPLQ